MNINVQVRAASAQAQIAALQKQVRDLQKVNGALAGSAGNAGNAINGMVTPGVLNRFQKWGNQIQWTGRQIQYNWTLPIVLAGAAATKFALDQERAFVHVRKVYGDTTAAAQQFQKTQNLTADAAMSKANKVKTEELEALSRAFDALSVRYATQKTQVYEIAGAWAAAGQSGVALAKSTELTLKAVILGDMDRAKATEALIAIQSQYHLSTQELNKTLAELNAIENATAINMPGLIEGFARTAGVAKDAGIPVRQLGALLAALVPASGTASQAGNALKTMISRLMAPTREATQVMKEMGFQLESKEWQSATALERLKMMSKEFRALPGPAKQAASAVIASRWQINKFAILMEELGPGISKYEEALNATANTQKSFTTAQQELNAVLESNPKKFDAVKVALQNSLARVITPLLPYIIYLAQSLERLVTSFSNLNPHVQKFALLGLIMLAAVGPIAKYVGSLATLIGTLIEVSAFFVRTFTRIPGVLFGFIFGIRGATGVLGKLIALMISSAGVFKSFGSLMVSAFTIGPVALKGFLAFAGSFKVALVAFITSMNTLAIAGLTKFYGIFATGIMARAGVAGGPFSALLATFKTFVTSSIGFFFTGGLLLGRSIVNGFRIGGLGLALVTGKMFAKSMAATYVGTSGILAVFKTQLARMLAINLLALRSLLSGWAKHLGALVTVTATAMTGVFTFLTGSAKFFFTNGILLAKSFVNGFRLGGIGLATAVSTMFMKSTAALYVGTGGLLATMKLAMTRLVATYAAGMHSIAVVTALMFTPIKAAWAAGMSGVFLIAKNGIKNLVIALATFGGSIVAAIGWPWTLAIAAVIALVLMFGKQISQIWNNIVKFFSDSNNSMIKAILSAWYALPTGVTNALVAVAKVVRKIALQIYEWFSYINPFARHSPSLVENVTQGMQEINRQFATLSKVEAHVKSAYATIKEFGKATAKITGGVESFQANEDRKKIKKNAPSALPSYDKMRAALKVLKADADEYNEKIEKQSEITDRLKDRLDAANDALDAQDKILRNLKKIQSDWSSSLDAAKDKLNGFANAPIQGMRAMSDAMFDNEMAQKRLKLALLQMGDGGSIDKIKDKLAAMQGEIETITAQREDLRQAGAGSDILQAFNDQIAAIQAQGAALQQNMAPVQEMNNQLADLQHQAEIMDLTNSLQFDPLTRQIEQAANAMEELPFDQIMAGIQSSNIEIAYYTEKVNEATAAVQQQQAIVDQLTAARDLLQDSYDVEKKKLDALTDTYQKVNSAIRDIESALNDVASAASKANDKLSTAKKAGGKGEHASPGLENFRTGMIGNFADTGGAGLPSRTDWSSQVADIDKYTQELTDKAGGAFAMIDPFGGIKEKWKGFKDWMSQRGADFKKAFSDLFSSAGEGVGFDGLKSKFDSVVKWATDLWDKIVKGAQLLWSLIGPDIMQIVDTIKSKFGEAVDKIGPPLKDLFNSILPLLSDMWKRFKLVSSVIFAVLLPVIKVIASVFADVLGPVIDVIIDTIKNLVKIITGVVKVIHGIMTGDFSKIADGLGDIFKGIFVGIWDIIKNAAKIIWGLIKGLVTGIWDFFVWLWDVLVGHSIVPDMIDGIIACFKWLISIPKWVWDNVLKPLFDFFVAIWNTFIQPALALWWAGIQLAWAALKTAGQWLWDNVLGPIWDKVKSVWNDFIQPGLAAWWVGIQLAWAVLKTAAIWLWDNVLSPIWNKVKSVWDDYIKPSLAAWWAGIQLAWAALKVAGQWLWDNVLNPVWNKVKDVWNSVSSSLSGWWAGIKNVWDSLTGIGTWFKTNVMDKVYNTVTNVWINIKDWLTKNKEMLTGPMKGIVNTVISAVNKIISGLNKVSDILPGVEWHISAIPELAQGGALQQRRVGSGFKTNGPRAIVGEGKANYPEYVIPTDPTYRKRAIGLLGAAMGKMNLGGPGGEVAEVLKAQQYLGKTVPMFASGGALPVGNWLSGLANGASNIAGSIAELTDNPVGTLMTPLFGLGRKLIANAGAWPPPKIPPTYAINKLEDWATSTDAAIKKISDNYGGGPAIQRGLAWARTQAGKPYVLGGSGNPGWDCSGFMGGITNVVRGNSPGRVGTTATFPWSGFKAGVAPGKGFTIGSTSRYPGSNMGHMAGTIGGVNVESRGGAGVLVGSGARGYGDSGFSQIYHLARGGIVRARRGGTLIRAGEAGQNEAVIPLPNGMKDGMGDTYNFYGDLEFPNITNPDDASEFINNLKKLAG